MKFKFINTTDSKTKELPLPKGEFSTTSSANVTYEFAYKDLQITMGPYSNHLGTEDIDDLINFLEAAKDKLNEN